MELTLRKAHKMIEKLHSRIAQIHLNATAPLGIWDVEPVESRVVAARAQFNNTVDHHFNLLAARQEIRDAIQAKNSIQINQLIADRKRLLDAIGVHRHILSTAQMATVTGNVAAERKIKSLQDSASTTSYGVTEHVQVSLLSQEDIDDRTQTINRLLLEVESIEDQLTTANATTTVTLSQQVVATLKAEGLI